MKTVIFDIDGTLADLTHRLHYIRPVVGKTMMDDRGHEHMIVEVCKSTRGRQVRTNTSGKQWVAAKDIGFKPDWDAFHGSVISDTRIDEICELASWMFDKHAEYPATEPKVLFLSGRMNKQVKAVGGAELVNVRHDTLRWLSENVHYEINDDFLFMRDDEDYRPDFEVKEDILQHLHDTGHEPVLAFDDRQQVVDMWRRNGIRCAQVAEGNF